MFPGYEFLFLVLITASLYDLWRYQVPNILVVTALIISLLRCFEALEAEVFLMWLSGILIPFTLCYIFYKFGMIGASDIKLFSVVGSFYYVSFVLKVMIISLFIGGILSIFKIILRKNARNRIRVFFSYLLNLKKNRKITPYYNLKADGDEGVIPFSIAISLATLICTL